MTKAGGGMSDQLLRAAQIEEAALLVELRRNVAFCKLEAVRSVIAAYGGADRLAPAAGVVSTLTPPPRPFERSGSQTGALTRAAAAYLSKVGRRAQVTEILPVLQAEGHVVGGKKPDGTLSSALSHSELFDNVRGKGYGLAEWGGTDGPSAVFGSQDNEPSLPATDHYRPSAAIVDREPMQGSVGPKAMPQGSFATSYSIADHDGRIKDEVA